MEKIKNFFVENSWVVFSINLKDLIEIVSALLKDRNMENIDLWQIGFNLLIVFIIYFNLENWKTKYSELETYKQKLKNEFMSKFISLHKKQRLILDDYLFSKNESFTNLVNKLNECFNEIHKNPTKICINEKSKDNNYMIFNNSIKIDMLEIINTRNEKLIESINKELTELENEIIATFKI